MPLDDLKNKIAALQAFDFKDEQEKIVNDHADSLADYQRNQMWDGKDSKGDWIRPFYSENPYFDSPAAALKYAQYKQKITPNPKRPLDVPNLIINGYYHYSLFATIVSGKFFFESVHPDFAEKVQSVHKSVIGLNPESRLDFAENFTLPLMRRAFRDKTGFLITTKR